MLRSLLLHLCVSEARGMSSEARQAVTGRQCVCVCVCAAALSLDAACVWQRENHYKVVRFQHRYKKKWGKI